jgi:hypothetical protein
VIERSKRIIGSFRLSEDQFHKYRRSGVRGKRAGYRYADRTSLTDVVVGQGYIFQAAAKAGHPVRLAAQTRRCKPTMRQEITRPAVRMPRLVHATPPSG